MQFAQKEIDYFNKSFARVPEFWSRFPCTSIKEKFILDVGCGHGALCIDMALRGAKKIIGIDINKRLIDFAKDNLTLNFPELKQIIDFRIGDISTLPLYEFDLITSKDTFEHIDGPDKCLAEMKIRLKPYGEIYIGFGPLYNSPFGGHGRMKIHVPWGHLLIPEFLLIKRLNIKNPERKIERITDLGLNKMSLARVKRIFSESGLHILFFKINQSKNPISKLFSLLRWVQFVEEYFSHNLYCILQKK